MLELAPASEAAPDGSATSRESASWYDEREGRNAETLFRDDLAIMTAELVDESELASARVDIRFSLVPHHEPTPGLRLWDGVGPVKDR